MSPRHRNFTSSWESDGGGREQPQKCSVSGKRMYATEGEANATAAHRMSDKHGMSDKEGPPGQLRSYLCIYCMAWHLTSSPGSGKRKK
jgi:hypothetical protein